jgi:hypothetical protein
MIEKSTYLIDSNTLIQAKNLYYQHGFCGSFWKWILDAHNGNILCTINKVKKEIFKGDKEDDLLKKWASENLQTSFFHQETNDIKIMGKYAEIMLWAAKNQQYNQLAKETFARDDIADAFLIAAACAYGLTIVSHEKPAPNSKKSIKIPDVASQFGVNTISLYDLLSKHAEGDFIFKP